MLDIFNARGQNMISVTIKICPSVPIDPAENDNLGTIVYRTGAKYRLGYKERSAEEMEEIENDSDYICLPVYAYIHSGVVLNTTGYTCPWDSGQCGIIYVSKDKVRQEFSNKYVTKKVKEKVYEILREEVETFSKYLSGEAYEYEVTYGDGESNSVGGYESVLECMEAATEDAYNYMKGAR